MSVETPVPQASFSKFIRTIEFASVMAVVGLLLYALHACATELRIVHHSFEFGLLDPNKDIEVLNYRYGDSKQAIAKAEKEYLAMGHIPQADNVSSFSPPGDSLYVKWRVQSTGKIFEDTVDLKGRLPVDMDGKRIHFGITGPQLYVYLIEGETSAQLHAKNAPDCPPVVYKPFKCARIYPDRWKNF